MNSANGDCRFEHLRSSSISTLSLKRDFFNEECSPDSQKLILIQFLIDFHVNWPISKVIRLE